MRIIDLHALPCIMLSECGNNVYKKCCRCESLTILVYFGLITPIVIDLMTSPDRSIIFMFFFEMVKDAQYIKFKP